MEFRIEHDTMGEVKVRADKYWGAATQRSLENFKIGTEKMPPELIHAIAAVKLAAVRANRQMCSERMTAEKCSAISRAAEEVMSGALDGHFPLSVWQTGSGTQTNMNLNEVIAHRAGELLGAPVHPNDDVNMSQSSNDVFPSAMHISAVMETKRRLLPALRGLVSALKELEHRAEGIMKSGRTHLQDATPVSFSDEVSGWRSSLECDIEMIERSLEPLSHLAIGGTATGTGINAPRGFGDAVASELSEILDTPFFSHPNKFHALSSKGELAAAHGALSALAADLMKIANDVRWLASGPRLGLGEITLPENEPGSSIMPGKVNPTQCEAVTMVAVQVMANNGAVSFAASQGNFELNVFMPVIAHNYLSSLRLLSDVCRSFTENCISGIKINERKMKENLEASLMLVTALSPHIGYERAAEVAKMAHRENTTLKAACLALGYLTEAELDEYLDPGKMV
ncbi:MAG: class II fumarate hydratase [Clostridia bacterium]|nr:class II fumarate hydratase [Clostridia bacterium]